MALYAFFLLVAPFEHHDLACHLKTPFHCTSCVSSHVGSDTDTVAPVGAWALEESGRASTAQPLNPTRLIASGLHGRSPPARG